MIELNHLELSFDSWSMRIDLEVGRGAFCALIGPSGAGKSTILNAIAGFLPHAPGQVLIGGQDMAGLAPAMRPVSMLFQEHNLFAHMSVSQNVALGINPDLKLSRQEMVRIEKALEMTGLSGLGDRLPHALSGGQRQRASLARAILRDKPVLLLDEPFAALGPALRKDMLKLVKDLAAQSGQTVMMVTHHPEDARQAADQTSLVHDGQIAQSGPTDQVFTEPGEALKDYLG